MKILDIPLLRPVVIIVIFGLVAYLGVTTYLGMKYELTPAMSIPMATVQTIYPGASPKEVEDQVSRRIEDAVSGVAHIRHVYANSYENFSLVRIEFEPDTDINMAVQDVQRMINQNSAKLPKEAKTPSVSKLSLDDQPILQMALTANIGPGELERLVREEVNPRLSRIAGVGQVTVIGATAREIRISLRQSMLEQYAIPILLVQQKLAAANLDFPAGSIKDADGQYVVRVAGKFKNLDEIRDLVIQAMPGGAVVHLGDIGEVVDSLAEPETILRYNGTSTLGMQVIKQSGANAVEVSSKVKQEIHRIETEGKAQGVHFTIAQDSTNFTLESAHDVIFDIILAIIFVGIIMLLFLHDLRNAFIVMMAIPATLLATLIGMGAGNFSLNLMSLLALTLVIGILVDDSIVVIENIHRHRLLGKSPFEAARVGAREIGFAAFAITLVIVVAFLPVSLAGGLIGQILLQFGLTIVLATAISLFVSFTLTPLLASRMSAKDHGPIANGTKLSAFQRFGGAFDRAFESFGNFFQRLLGVAMRHKLRTLGLAVLLLFGSLGLVASGLVGTEFMAQIDRGEFNINIQMPERTSLEENDRTMRQIETMLRSRNDVKDIYTKVGFTGSVLSNFETQIAVALVPRRDRHLSSVKVGEQVEQAIRTIPGLKVEVAQLGIVDMAGAPITYVVSGPRHEDNLAVAEQYVAIMRGVQGTGETRLSVGNGKPELRIDIDRRRMADLGLSLDAVGASLRTALTGNSDLVYNDNGTDYGIKLVLDSFDRTSTAQLGNIGFVNNQGRAIRLSQFAAITPNLGPTILTRQDRTDSITINAQAIGRSTGEIAKEIAAKAKQINIPSGVTIQTAGMLSMQSESFGSLGLTLILSMILIYAILAILFNSLAHPIGVLFSLPFALVGGFFALALTHQTLNIFSIMAMILLMGLTAKNGILLVDRALRQAAQGMSLEAAFKDAVATRIRPIVMTTAAMIFGMLPVALGLGSAGEMKSAMGVVLIGGLFLGMLITMIVVPIAFLSVDALRRRLGGKPIKAAAVPEELFHE